MHSAYVSVCTLAYMCVQTCLPPPTHIYFLGCFSLSLCPLSLFLSVYTRSHEYTPIHEYTFFQ